MAPYNTVFVPTRFASIENARKADKKGAFSNYNNKVYKEIWRDAMRGKIKDFIVAHAVASNSYGSDYNGYGWGNHHNDYYLSLADGKALLQLVAGKKAEKNPVKTWQEIRDAWAKRLVRCLDGAEEYAWVTFEVAQQIAEEKDEYKTEQINMMIERQNERYSVRREKLINKMERENPLRRIEGYDHAVAIIKASERHNNCNYETLLEEYREDAKMGIIDHSEVKQLARENYIYINH